MVVAAPRALLLTVPFLALTLAGCSEAPAEAAPEIPDLGLEVTATTGLIRGVVVDEAIRPVAGVAIVARSSGQPDRSTTSLDTGFFGFDGLAPGSWFLQTERQGYLSTQSSAEVVAGVAEPPIVKIQLLRDVENLPYAVLDKFDGYLECGLSVIALCGAGQGTPVFGNLTNDRFAGTVPVDKPPQWIQSEMVWSPTTSASDQLWLWHSRTDKETGDYAGSCNCWVQGPSPLVMTTNETVASHEDYGNDYGNSTDLYLRIFTGSVEGTRNPLSPEGCYPGQPVGDIYCGGVGYSLQQSFTVYTVLFYGYLPPEGWLFVSEGQVPDPPA